MKKEDTEMMLRILKRRGQDMPIFIRVMEGRKEDYISTTAENIANYIGSHKPKRSSSQICVTG